jgi:hypothetical protein
LWRWLSDRAGVKVTAPQALMSVDPRLAKDLRAAANVRKQPTGR